MKIKVFFPLIIALAMAFGFWLGSGLRNPLVVEQSSGDWGKIDEILRYVEDDYVDTVSRQKLEEEVIAYLLQRLDPHSYYIEGKQLQAFNEPLEGGFEGIGVQFNIRQDSVYIINTIAGGPAEAAGMKPGDRIVKVEADTIAGNGVTNSRVMKLLKGLAGTSVNVSVRRPGVTALVDINIQRGEIPIRSVDAVYQLDSNTLYVRLERFARTTSEEFEERVVPYANKGVDNIILDLRGNGGGFLDAAIYLADEFLTKGRLITYTEGRSRPRQEYRASSSGHFEETKLYLLMDEFSASASEILAGAVQDHHRGVIIGERSFGKGLVQEQNEWPDGSATRLTVARYYTPNGRSIQKPYEGMPDDLELPLEGADSTSIGGIEPDVDVKNDTSSVSWLYAEVVHRGLLNDFAYDFRDRKLPELTSMDRGEYLRGVEVDTLLGAMRTYFIDHHVVIDERDWKKSANHMATRVKAIIGRSLFGDDLYFQIINQYDSFVQTAVEEMKKSGA